MAPARRQGSWQVFPLPTLPCRQGRVGRGRARAACKHEDKEAARLLHRDKGFSTAKMLVHRGLTSMRKTSSSSPAIGAGIVAVTAGILLVGSHDMSGQGASEIANEVADAGSAPIPDRPDWNWDV